MKSLMNERFCLFYICVTVKAFPCRGLKRCIAAGDGLLNFCNMHFLLVFMITILYGYSLYYIHISETKLKLSQWSLISE